VKNVQEKQNNIVIKRECLDIKMNKNPKRHKDINKTISQLLNPKETQSQKNKRIKKEINEMIKW